MADRQKVINGLTDIDDEAYDRWVHCQYTQDKLLMLIKETIPDAIALLTEQVPAALVFDKADNAWHCCCGNCHKRIDNDDKYCRHCGIEVRHDA